LGDSTGALFDKPAGSHPGGIVVIMKKRKIRVGVLFGGISEEHDVSLMSTRSILDTLSHDKYEVTEIGITRDGRWLSGEHVLESLQNGTAGGLQPVFLLPQPDHGRLYLQNGSVLKSFAELDVFFPVLHGTYGEDGLIQGLFELSQVPYVGAGVTASATCMNKSLFKHLMRSVNIPVVDSLDFSRSRLENHPDEVIAQIERRFPYPLFVKPVNCGSSVGVSKCKQRGELKTALMEAARYDGLIAVEPAIDAIEVEISLLGNNSHVEASVCGEVRYQQEFYSYDAKYFDEDTHLVVPAPLSSEIAQQVEELALHVFQAVGAAGMARVDFFVERGTQRVLVNEANTIPGFTRTSMVPRLWQASGMSYASLLDRLIELALERS
jgi:D-alanine-D-alanine ligase